MIFLLQWQFTDDFPIKTSTDWYKHLSSHVWVPKDPPAHPALLVPRQRHLASWKIPRIEGFSGEDYWTERGTVMAGIDGSLT